MAGGRQNRSRTSTWTVPGVPGGPLGILSAVVQPKDAKLKLGIAELGFELKRNPNYRQLVRDHLRLGRRFPAGSQRGA